MVDDEDAAFDGSLLAADKRCSGAFKLRYGRSLSSSLYMRLLVGGAQQDEQD